MNSHPGQKCCCGGESKQFVKSTYFIHAILTKPGMVEIHLPAFAITCVTNGIQLSFILHSGLQQLHFQRAVTWVNRTLVIVALQ